MSGRVSGPVRTVRIWALLAAAALRAQLRHRADLAFCVLGGLAFQGVGLAVVGTLLARFHTIGGWRPGEIMLLYGLRLTAHGLWTVPFAQLLNVDQAIQQAELDRYLTRPAGVLVQLLTRQLAPVSLGDLAGGLAVLAVALPATRLSRSPALVGYLLLALAGAALLEASLHLVTAALAVRLAHTTALTLTTDNLFNTFGNYPLRIFGPGLRWALTAAFPLAFAAYFPAAALLGRDGELWVPPTVAWAAPAAGVLLVAVAYRFWRYQLAHYASSGS
ncbi:ABC transporter permease [Rugosimonospora africana]|uniref:ABC transporter permease n=1 Tax=Rugosimonospora africana TaxID=556532 RepID=UPI001941C312|nr:ABC-2 family transporter protein [Rugosimonospora africana]